MPSEAEWEYAARAGTKTKYSWGNDIDCGKANYGFYNGACSGNTEGTKAVGNYTPNAFGLYDMHGNVWEWVEDLYYENYKGAAKDGSSGMGENGANRVLRGGSWINFGGDARSAVRLWSRPDYRFNLIGFRLARGQK